MKASVSFTVETDYIQTGFNELIKIGNYKWIDGKCVWNFPLKHIKRAENIFGTPIEFDPYHHVEILQSRMPLKTETADIPEFKGISGRTINLLEDEKKYEIISWQKIENGDGTIEVKEQKQKLPMGLRQCMFDVLTNIDENRFKDHKIGCRTIAKKMVDKLHIDRFNRNGSGTFSWSKFFGVRRDYFNFYYLPLKILVYEGAIIHHKNGKVTKINKEKWWGDNGYNQKKIWKEET